MVVAYSSSPDVTTGIICMNRKLETKFVNHVCSFNNFRWLPNYVLICMV